MAVAAAIARDGGGLALFFVSSQNLKYFKLDFNRYFTSFANLFHRISLKFSTQCGEFGELGAQSLRMSDHTLVVHEHKRSLHDIGQSCVLGTGDIVRRAEIYLDRKNSKPFQK